MSGASSTGSMVRNETTILALRGEEAERTAVFGRATAILCGTALVMLAFLENSSWLYPLMIVGMVGLGAAGAWVWYRARNPLLYTRSMFRMFAFTGLFAALAASLYLGFFSSVGAVVALGISFFALGDDQKFVFGAIGTLIAAYFSLALMTALRVLPDMGVFVPVGATTPALVFNASMISMVYLVTLWQARLSRRATIEAIERSSEAARVAQRREAQLAEANLNLDVALRAGAGQQGRYSGLRAGSYLLDRVVGRGAMGEVYAAVHEPTGRPAAVKLMHRSALEDRDIAARFFREAEIELQLKSAYVVQVYDFGKAHDGAPFIAMELLTGHDLAWHLRQKQTLTLPELVTLIDEVARGLSVAHDKGIVHRDLKPQNLFLAEGGARAVWKIVDFGVSRFQESGGTLTEGAIIGTPGYMSPEQAQSKKCDRRADIFSLGAVTYRALTGTPAFTGQSPPQILYEVVFGTPARPSDLIAGIPRELDAVIAIALAKRPEDRFATALEMSEALRAAARGEIDLKLVRKARGLLAQLPWGRSTRDRQDAPTLVRQQSAPMLPSDSDDRPA